MTIRLAGKDIAEGKNILNYRIVKNYLNRGYKNRAARV